MSSTRNQVADTATTVTFFRPGVSGQPLDVLGRVLGLFPGGLPPRHLRGGLRQVSVILQAAVLLSVGLVVVGVLWIRELKTAELIRLEHPGYELEFQADCGTGVSRPKGVEWGLDAPGSPTAVADPQRVKSILPTGMTYIVSVTGGFVAGLREADYGHNRRLNVAYMFEMRYRRTIESNDGRRIVERRCFQEVRMAKIVSPADDMRLRSSESNGPILDNIEFPDPGSGIVVGPMHTVARAMLSYGVDSVAADPRSRAFLEHDALSGKTVRLTFVDGQGVISVEPIDWTLTSSAAYHLLCQPILHMNLIPGQGSSGSRNCTVDLGHLAHFLDPSVAPSHPTDVLIEPAGTREGTCDRYSLSLVWDEDTDEPVDIDDVYRTTSEPIGVLEYDSTAGIVTAATVNWPMIAVDVSGWRLLYEQWHQFEQAPVLSICYRSQAG
jgi:hypothetical protein